MSKNNRKEKILDAVFSLFAEKGYAVSMADIAKEVGLKPGSLYSHFESKEQVVFLTAQREIYHYYDSLALLFKDCKIQRQVDQLAAIFFFTVAYFEDLERLHFWQHLLAIPDTKMQQRCRELLRARDGYIVPKVAEIIRQGIEGGVVRPEAAAGFPVLYSTMVLGVVEGLLIYGWPPETFKQNAKIVWDNFARGVFCDPSD